MELAKGKCFNARNFKQNLGKPHFVLAYALAACGKENAEGC